MFKSDLAFGKIWEEEAKKMMNGMCEPSPPGQFKPYDFTCLGKKYEVKSDRLALQTGNIFVEFSCSGIASGIASTEADFWIYFILESCYDDDDSWTPSGWKAARVYRIPISSLLEIVSKNNSWKVKGGDGGRVQGYLIKEILFNQFQIYPPGGPPPSLTSI